MSTKTILPPDIVMAGDAARTRKSDPVTSHEAADSTTGSVFPSQAYVYDTLRWFGRMADHELVAFHEAEVGAGYPVRRYSPSRLRSARAALVVLGLVVDTGDRVRMPSGRRAVVWAVAS